MLTDTELIRKLDFFEPLDQKIIKQIASLCIVREFAAGEAIVRQGEAGLGLYFITAGRAKVEIEREQAKVVVAELKEGDFLGEFSIIDEKTRSASVVCLQETRCLLLTRDTFAKLLQKYPEIANQMLRTLVGRIRNTNERISQPVGQPVGQPAVQAVRGPAPKPAPSSAESSPIQTEADSGGSSATQQITAMIPKPEELVQFYSSTKGKTQDYLNRFFGTIYAMKAMLRFSMAIVGCPVTVHAEMMDREVIETEMNGVKLVLFPATSNQTIRINALADGDISATLYRPLDHEHTYEVEVLHLRGQIRENDILRLHVKDGDPIQVESGAHLVEIFPADGACDINSRLTVSKSRWS